MPALDGKTFQLNVPAGTQSGAMFRIPNQGLYVINTHHRGHLMIRLRVVIPTNLDPRQMDLVRQIQVSL